MELSRICLLMQNRSHKMLKRLEAVSHIKLDGEVNFTRDPSKRYAHVQSDPDYLFVDPSYEWVGARPKYEVWIGDREADHRRVNKAFNFIIAHEAAHVIRNACSPSDDQLTPPISELRSRAVLEHSSWYYAGELMVDAQALSLPATDRQRQGIFFSMISVSEMMLTDFQEERLARFTRSAMAREMAKLKWVEEQSLPGWLRAKAAQTYQQYQINISSRIEKEMKQTGDFAQLLLYYQQLLKIRLKGYK